MNQQLGLWGLVCQSLAWASKVFLFKLCKSLLTILEVGKMCRFNRGSGAPSVLACGTLWDGA